MNTLKKVLCACLIVAVLFTAVQAVKAYSGSFSDNRVDMIWWSQGGGSNMYWTGVTNKISYDRYKPCVGRDGSEFSCGVAAAQSEYEQYGFWINMSQIGTNVVVHGLATQSGGYTSPLQYQQRVTVTPADQ